MWKLLFVFTFIVLVASYENPCDDPNAAPPPAGCVFNCNRHCSNYLNHQKSICPRVQCPPEECGCKQGYYYDANCKKCVLPQYCTSPQPT